MTYHVLNGDSLAYSFPEAGIEGTVVVARECLIDGDLSGDNLQRFWQTRAAYIGVTEAEYHLKVVNEFEKIIDAPGNAEFNLWFEYDLFCQVNMWFIVSLIRNLPRTNTVYAVYTSHLTKESSQFWNGFGRANAGELRSCFANRIPLNDADLQLGKDLWLAYQRSDFEELSRLAENQSAAFPYLKEVVKAHVDRFPKGGEKGRPEKVIEEILQNGTTDFPAVFKEFWNRESIYGFGDTQLEHLYDKVKRQGFEERPL